MALQAFGPALAGYQAVMPRYATLRGNNVQNASFPLYSRQKSNICLIEQYMPNSMSKTPIWTDYACLTHQYLYTRLYTSISINSCICTCLTGYQAVMPRYGIPKTNEPQRIVCRLIYLHIPLYTAVTLLLQPQFFLEKNPFQLISINLVLFGST